MIRFLVFFGVAIAVGLMVSLLGLRGWVACLIGYVAGVVTAWILEDYEYYAKH